MKAMIHDHSVAIITSRRTAITDPRERALAYGIAATQVHEIAQMKALIQELDPAEWLIRPLRAGQRGDNAAMRPSALQLFGPAAAGASRTGAVIVQAIGPQRRRAQDCSTCLAELFL